MKKMTFIEISDIFSGDDVDFGVPSIVKMSQSFIFGILSGIQFREIFPDQVHRLRQQKELYL